MTSSKAHTITRSEAHTVTHPKTRTTPRPASHYSAPRPKVSVLVPVYNVEKFLPECLESLISQTLAELEIICINDGSTDHSEQILAEYAAKDPRIVIINKPNSGYGDSMNQGLKKARGDYIGIVESDDWIESEAFEILHELATSNSAEVVRSNYYHLSKGINTKYHAIDPTQVGYLLDPHHPKYRHIFYEAPAIWSALYRRDFLEQNDINFLPTPGASYQDTGFNFKVWASAHRVYFTDAAFIHYRTDNASSSVKSLAKVFNIVKEYSSIESYLRAKHLFDGLAGTFHYAKFAAYYWNALRLPYQSAKTFLATMRSEFLKAESHHEINWQFFPKKDAAILKLIMYRPPLCFYLMQTFKNTRAWLFSKLSSLHKILRPAYRRQHQTILELNALIDQNDKLRHDIDRLERQIHRLKATPKGN